MGQAYAAIPAAKVTRVCRNLTNAPQAVSLKFHNTKLLPAMVGYGTSSELALLDERAVKVGGRSESEEVSLVLQPSQSVYVATKCQGVEVFIQVEPLSEPIKSAPKQPSNDSPSAKDLEKSFLEPKALLSQMGYPGGDPIFQGMADSFKKAMEEDK